jgi:tetratricopeptide (TPR) repeat protein
VAPETDESVHQLLQEAAALRRQLKAEEAVAVAERALDIAEHGSGADSEQLREVQAALAELRRMRDYLARVARLRDAAEFAEAASVARRVLAIQILRDGADHPATAKCRSWLAEIDRQRDEQRISWAPLEARIDDSLRAGNLELAANATVGLLRTQRSRLGNGHTAVAETLMQLGWLAEPDGKAQTAAPRFTEAIGILSEVLGEDDWRVGDARLDMETLRRCGRLSPKQQQEMAQFRARKNAIIDDSGAAVYQSRRDQLARDVEMVRRYVGTDSEYYASAVLNLGIACHLGGDLPEAHRLLEQSVSLTESVCGTRHPEHVLALSQLGMVCLDLADHQRAVGLLQRAVDLAAELFGEINNEYVMHLHQLAQACYRARQYDVALPLMRRATEFWREARGTDSANYGHLLSELSHVYGAVADVEHERNTALEALEVLRRTVGEANKHYLEALNHVALIEKRSRRYDESVERFRQLVDTARRVYGPHDRMYGVYLASAASFYQSRVVNSRAVTMLD